MKETSDQSPQSKTRWAFTVTELLIVIACLALLAAIWLPAAMERAKARSSRINCGNNLKQIGLAFKMWALDNNDHLPMQVSVTNGGTMELVASGSVFPHFQVMSNELSTPFVLLCPEDKKRTRATNFTSNLTDKHLSYFVGTDSVDGSGSSLLCGDRNLTNKPPTGNRFINVTSNTILGWTKDIHSEKGYLLFEDGSVRTFTNGSAAATATLGASTNRLAVP